MIIGAKKRGRGGLTRKGGFRGCSKTSKIAAKVDTWGVFGHSSAEIEDPMGTFYVCLSITASLGKTDA